MYKIFRSNFKAETRAELSFSSEVGIETSTAQVIAKEEEEEET